MRADSSFELWIIRDQDFEYDFLNFDLVDRVIDDKNKSEVLYRVKLLSQMDQIHHKHDEDVYTKDCKEIALKLKLMVSIYRSPRFTKESLI